MRPFGNRINYRASLRTIGNSDVEAQSRKLWDLAADAAPSRSRRMGVSDVLGYEPVRRGLR